MRFTAEAQRRGGTQRLYSDRLLKLGVNEKIGGWLPNLDGKNFFEQVSSVIPTPITDQPPLLFTLLVGRISSPSLLRRCSRALFLPPVCRRSFEPVAQARA
jgi:hypothetical protein